jgi:endogenous inhibitor of DNA gyrase (YacG/DUF329 family)
MNTSTVHCPVCDRKVHVTATDAPLHPGPANLPDAPELVCLTFGQSCAGGRCGLSGLASVVMGVRLARSGMTPDEEWHTIRMHCELCNDVTEMKVLDNVSAFCPECGTAHQWFNPDAGDESPVPPPVF